MEVIDRSKRLGGSDVAAALGFSKWKTPLQLAQEKRKPRVQTEETDGPKAKIFKRGKRWESVALEMLVESLTERGHTVEVVGTNEQYTDPEFPFLACEVDARLVVDGEEMNAEIKTVHPFAIGEWGITEGSEPMNDQIPIWYASQVQHGMMVTGRSKCVVGALIGADDMLPYLVPRDDEVISWMRPALVDFWNECVLGGIDPDPINIDDVRRLYQPTKDGIEVDETMEEVWLRYRAIKREIKSREAELDLAEFHIARFMKDHQVLLGRDGKELMTFKMRDGTYFDETALKTDNPSLFKQYVRKWTKRVLSPRYPQSV